MSEHQQPIIEKYRKRLENSRNYGETWNVVRDTVAFSLHKRRRGMMLFLDDLPIQLGAYHPIGTNNIVLNRTLVQIVEATIKTKRVVNALVYNLLVHEYLHALGEYSEQEVRETVHDVASKCFGEDYIATSIAKKSPWSLLHDIPLEAISTPKQAIEIVKDFEAADDYIV